MQNLGIAVVVLLAAQICVLALNGVALVMRVRLLARIEAGGYVTRDQAEARDSFVAGTALVWLLVFLATVIVWSIWQHRAQGNARALTHDATEFTPGWAVGWWFVPIANLFKPFQTFRELWKASQGRDGWRALPTWPLIGWWWATWLAYNIIANTAWVTRGDTVESLHGADNLDIASNAFGIVSAVLAIQIVRSVIARQQVAVGESATVVVPPAPVPLPPPPLP
jgi:Domain of unknown function (DUF4328)